MSGNVAEPYPLTTMSTLTTTPAQVEKFAKKLASLKEAGIDTMATITRTLSAANTTELRNELGQALWGDNAEGIKINAAMSEQCRKWLHGLAYTPTGKERTNSPFGYREQDVVNNFGSVVWVDYYQAGYYSHQVTGLFNVYSTDGAAMFQYYVWGGKINIVG